MKSTVTTFNVENLFNRYTFLNQPWAECAENKSRDPIAFPRTSASQ